MWSRTATDASGSYRDDEWSSRGLPSPGAAAASVIAAAAAAAGRAPSTRAHRTPRPTLVYSRSIYIKRVSPPDRHAAPSTPFNWHKLLRPRVTPVDKHDGGRIIPDYANVTSHKSSHRWRWQDYVSDEYHTSRRSKRSGSRSLSRVREHNSNFYSPRSGDTLSYGTARSNFLDESWAMEGDVSTVGSRELHVQTWWSAEDLLEEDRERRVRRPQASSPWVNDDSTPAGVLYSAPYLRDVLSYLVSLEKVAALPARSTLDPVLRAQLVDWLAKLNEYLCGSVGTLQAGVRLLDAAAPRLPGERPAALAAACYWLAAKQAAGDARDAACLVRHARGAFTCNELLITERRAAAALRYAQAPPVPEPHVEALCAALDARDVAPAAHHLCCAALPCASLVTVPPSALAAAAVAAVLRMRGQLDARWVRLLADEPGYYPLSALGPLSCELCVQARALVSPDSACREMHLLFAARRPRDAKLLYEQNLF